MRDVARHYDVSYDAHKHVHVVHTHTRAWLQIAHICVMFLSCRFNYLKVYLLKIDFTFHSKSE